MNEYFFYLYWCWNYIVIWINVIFLKIDFIVICNIYIGEHFLTKFCEMIRNCKRKVMFCNKVKKQCLSFNDLIIEGTVCTWQEWWNRLWLVLERNNFQVILSFSMSDYITFGRRSNVTKCVTKGAKCIPINIIYIRKKNSMGI